MISRMTFCSAQAVRDAFPALGADALQFFQAFRGGFDDVEHRFPKGPHQFLGEVGADALDHARAQVLLDAFQRTGRARS